MLTTTFPLLSSSNSVAVRSRPEQRTVRITYILLNINGQPQMRWFHRDQAVSSSPAPSFSLGQSPALHTLPSPSAHTRNTSSTLGHAAPRSRHSLDSFMDDNDNDPGSGSSHDHDHLTPQSLHIAPNLSALLEEDDRRRREEMGESASNAFDPSFSQSILGPFSDSSFSEPIQVGLPPPPRGPKKPVKPKQLPVGQW